MTTIVEKKKFSHLLFLLALIFMLPVQLLIFDIKIGLIACAGLILFLTVLIKPQYIFLLLISLFSIEGFAALENFSLPKIVAGLLTIGLFLRIAMTKETIPRDDAYKYFALFLIGSLVSFAFAKDPIISWKIYITYISLFSLYILTRYFLQNMDKINQALNYLLFSTLIIFVFLQLIGLSAREAPSFGRISGGIGDANALASFIVVLIPLALYRSLNSKGFLRILYWILIISFFFVLIFTFSRGGMLGFIGMIAILIYYYSIRNMKYIMFIILILATISIFFVPDEFWERASTIIHPELAPDQSINVRLMNYKASLKMFLDYPLGVGLNNFQLICINYGALKEKVVHNTYLEVLVGGGVLSFIPFSLIFINCWRKLKIKEYFDKNIRGLFICLRASFVSILITSSFISGDHKKILWFLFALISSAFYISINQHKASKSIDLN